MRLLLLPLAGFALVGATDDDPKVHESAVGVATPSSVSPSVLTPDPRNLRSDLEALSCVDRITKARAEAGQPPLLDRKPASPEKPYLIYAVDRRQDGCSVMVIKGDPNDIRPLPLPVEGHLRMMPALGE